MIDVSPKKLRGTPTRLPVTATRLAGRQQELRPESCRFPRCRRWPCRLHCQVQPRARLLQKSCRRAGQPRKNGETRRIHAPEGEEGRGARAERAHPGADRARARATKAARTKAQGVLGRAVARAARARARADVDEGELGCADRVKTQGLVGRAVAAADGLARRRRAPQGVLGRRPRRREQTEAQLEPARRRGQNQSQGYTDRRRAAAQGVLGQRPR